MRPLLINWLFWLSLPIFSQAPPDSLQYQVGMPMNDGFYRSYEDFRHSRVVLADSIDFSGNREFLDFMSKALEQEKVKYIWKGKKEELATKMIWAYVQNNTFYVNYKEKFYRVPVFGAISYFMALVEVRTQGYYDPRFGGYTGSMVTTEQREFVFSFYDGNIAEMKQEEVEGLLSKDKDLFAEYKSLSSRKQKEQLYRFIRRFNENHPVYFLGQ